MADLTGMDFDRMEGWNGNFANIFANLEQTKGGNGKHYTMIMQADLNSKSRYHLVGDYIYGKPVPNCQSYNLDKPNFLDETTRISSQYFNDELFEELNWNLCKKCFKGIIIL